MGRHKHLQSDVPSGFLIALAISAAAFLLGGATGILLAQLLEGDAAQELSGFLNAYLELVAQGDATVSFWAVLWQQLRFLLPALVLGFTALGLVGFPVLLAVRGFLLSFSVACLCRLLGTAGLLPAFFLYGLGALVWAPAFFLLSTQGLNACGCLLRRGLGESKVPLPYDSGYLVRCGFCVALVFLCVLLEYWAVPSLLRAAARTVM